MIHDIEVHRLAIKLLKPLDAGDVEIRRGISTLYYGLFHRLTLMGASMFHQGGAALVRQSTRAFSHSAMRKVCTAYVRSRSQPFPPPLDRLSASTSDDRISAIAEAFLKLLEAPHAVDYDLDATFSRAEGLTLLEYGEFARWKLDELKGSPDLAVFLAALLLHDRWTCNG